MRTPNFRAVSKRCQEIYNDPAITSHLVGILNRESDKLSIVNPDDTVRNLTTQAAGVNVFFQGIDRYGGIAQTFKEAVTFNRDGNAIWSNKSASPSFSRRSKAGKSTLEAQ